MNKLKLTDTYHACSHCCHFWKKRKSSQYKNNKTPKRCPRCSSSRWNKPLTQVHSNSHQGKFIYQKRKYQLELLRLEKFRVEIGIQHSKIKQKLEQHVASQKDRK